MVSNKLFLSLAILAVVLLLPAATMATEFVVGDKSGWTVDFDYPSWTKGKTFQVGDKLVFNYTMGSHNVFKVNGTAFASCAIPLSEPLSSGYDVIPLLTPGKKWYICGKGNHCAQRGQKLVINVEGSAPAPAPSSAYKTFSSAGYLTFVTGAVMAVAAMVLSEK